MSRCDILLVGVGGQGVMTLGDLLVRAAFAAEFPASFCPTKGMAQRGGFVKVEVRLGVAGAGPRIGKRNADVIVSMERSEALKGLPYASADAQFVLYDHVWEPTGVQLGQDTYPSIEDVTRAIETATEHLTVIAPSDVPSLDGKHVAANIVVLGTLVAQPRVAALLDVAHVRSVLETRWPKAKDANITAFEQGLELAEAPS